MLGVSGAGTNNYSKNFIIDETSDEIRFIVTPVINSTTNGIYIRTMNKQTHEYTDEDTAVTYSTAANSVGYTACFVHGNYLYLYKTPNNTSGVNPVAMYKINYKNVPSTIESAGNFPKTWSQVAFIKLGNVVYGFGGATSWHYTTLYKSIWKYNITTNVWTTLSAELPFIISHAHLQLSLDERRIYITMGCQSNVASGWSQKHACYFDIDTETVVQLADRSTAAFSGFLNYLPVGFISMPLFTRNAEVFTWKEFGNQLYLPETDKWLSFNANIPFVTGSSTDNSQLLTLGIQMRLIENTGNTMHVTVNGVSYYITLGLATLGLFSTGESLYITGIVKADKDVKLVDGTIITAGTAISENTEIKIISDDTRIILLSDIVTDGSWIRRPPYVLTGVSKETVLWEGSTGTNTSTLLDSTIDLSDSILSYDKIGMEFNVIADNGASTIFQYREYTHHLFKELITTHHNDVNYKIISVLDSQNNDVVVIESTSTETRLNVSNRLSYLTKIIGINYKILV